MVSHDCCRRFAASLVGASGPAGLRLQLGTATASRLCLLANPGLVRKYFFHRLGDLLRVGEHVGDAGQH